MSGQWGVAVAEPQRYRLAATQLAGHGYTYFMPMWERVSVRAGRHQHFFTPVFGRYLFVMISGVWQKISSLRGITGLLLNPETLHPWHVDSDQLDAVRALCDHNVMHKQEDVEMARQLMYGDPVSPKSGPLAGLRGVYEGKLNKHRESARFIMFGREQKIVFKVGELIGL